MISSIKPGKLAGMSPARIEESLSKLFGCDVEYVPYRLKIRCFDLYRSNAAINAHLDRLKDVGRVFWSYDREGPFIGLDFNEVAIDVISGARRIRDSLKHEEPIKQSEIST